MTSLPVNKIGSVMARGVSSETGMSAAVANSVSFESVWSNHTERQNQTEETSGAYRTVSKKDDFVAGNSLRSKDVHRKVTGSHEETERSEANGLDGITPEEMEKAMEVLGTAAVQMMTQVADIFDMTVDEVQNLMTELDMNPTDVLSQEGLNRLVLAAAGAESAADLLTDESLYQDLQMLTEQLNGVLKKCSEALQTDAPTLIQVLTDGLDKETVLEASSDTEPEDGMPAENEYGSQAISGDAGERKQDGIVSIKEARTENQTQEQLQEQGREQSPKNAGIVSDKSGGENLILQNLRMESLEPQLQQLSETASPWDSDTLDIMRQIMDYLKIQVKPDMSNLEMQLHPESLGSLQIHVASKGGNITAQFVTQNEAVKAALESQMIQLKESFAEQGVKVDAIEVTVQTHQFEQNLEQGRSRQQEETGRRTRTRRIQLDGAYSVDDGNGMEEEDRLAAEVMAANGNTVDYTA